MERRNGPPADRKIEELRALCDLFNRTFAPWAIELSPSDLAPGRTGFISSQGWAIWFLLGADEGGRFLDYYAAHRMTNDRHVRIRPNGALESLPAISTMRFLSADPEENARLGRDFVRHNRQVNALLREKGFGMTGREPLSISVNRYLALEDEE